MLARADRLTAGPDFAETIRRGRRAGARSLVVHLARETGDEGEARRAGFVVSRAVGPAVTRNRVKRRLRHLVRRRLAELPAASRLVVRALPPAAEATSEELDRDLGRALRRALERREGRGRPGSEGS
jgi:ribonuclease P protein component